MLPSYQRSAPWYPRPSQQLSFHIFIAAASYRMKRTQLCFMLKRTRAILAAAVLQRTPRGRDRDSTAPVALQSVEP